MMRDADESRPFRSLRHPARRGFTLIEMLTVIIIIGIVSGIALMGALSFRRGNALIAAEQLIVDVIRQARHTARSTGTPVILRISPVVNAAGTVVGGEIAGISQIPLASETFEDDERWQNPTNGAKQQSTTSSSSTTAPAKPFAVPGRSGHGLRIEATDGGTKLVFPKADDLALHFTDKDRSKRLVRKKGLTEGFYLAAAIRTPPVDEPTIYDAQGQGGRIDPKHEPAYVPVVVLGSDSGPTLEDSIAGLMLRRHQRPLQAVDMADPVSGVIGGKLLAEPLTTWEAVAWVRGEGDAAMVSSIDDAQYQSKVRLTDYTTWGDYSAAYPTITRNDPLRAFFQAQNQGGTSTGDQPYDIPAPIGDGRWLDLGVLFDGHELLLFLEGVPISRAAAPVILPFDDALNTLWIGTATLPTLGADPGSGKTLYAAAPALIDDVRLFRLGTDRPIALPKGVRPCLPGPRVTVPSERLDQPDLWFEITALPDGRVTQHIRTRSGASTATVTNEDQANTSAGAMPITLAATTDPAFLDNNWAMPRNRMELTVTITGRVTKKIIRDQEHATP